MGFKNKLKSLFSVDDEYEYEYVEEEIDTPQVSKTHKSDAQNVVNLTSMKQPTSKVVLCEPRTYNEAQEIADHVVNRRAVVINLERVDHMQAKRIVDFLSGTVYAVNRSEEHTSELQSRGHLVCRLLLEKKKRDQM